MKQESHFARIVEIAAIVAAFFHVGFFVTEHLSRAWFIGLMASTCLILILGLYVNPASRLRYFLRKMKRLFDRDIFARPDMYDQWQRHASLVFIGLSQRSMAAYLSEALASGRTYPWTHITVYFASDELGSVFEEADFLPNLRRSRQDIAAELTSPARDEQLPFLKEVRFYQNHALVGYSGSYFSRDTMSDPSVIYVVQSLPMRRGEAKRALTFRIAADGTERWNRAHQVVLRHYQEGLITIAKSRRSLGGFSPSIWDRSAADWSEFCRKSNVMQQEMQGLITFAGSLTDQRVLDVGCGSGEVSGLLLDANAEWLTVLDSSPQMLQHSRMRLNNRSNVTFALCRVPTLERENIDIEGQTFDLINLHQGIPAVAATSDELKAFAL